VDFGGNFLHLTNSRLHLIAQRRRDRRGEG
jgi:hypothetical protein